MKEPLLDEIRFTASLYRLNSDREGAVRLTLDVPESDLGQVLQVIRWKEMALSVRIRKHNE